MSSTNESINDALDADVDARAITAFAINHFGTGQHPVATTVGRSLSFFVKTYAVECLAKVVQSGKVTPEAVRLAQAAIKLLTGEASV